MSKTVAIAGVSGRLGRCLARELLKNPNVVVRGLARNLDKAEHSLRSSSLHLTQGAADDMDVLRRFVKGADVVICAYSGSDETFHDIQKDLIDACEAEGVPRYVAGDFTVDHRKLEYGQLWSKDPVKKVAEYLEGKSVSGVHVLIGAFLDTFWSSWFDIWNPEEESLSYWGTGQEKWELTSYQNAAEFTARVALDDSAIGYQKFLGDRKTIIEIANLFDNVYGKKPQLKSLGSLDYLKSIMNAKQVENPHDYMTWGPLVYQFYCINGQTLLGEEALLTSYSGLQHAGVVDFLSTHTMESLATAYFTVGE